MRPLYFLFWLLLGVHLAPAQTHSIYQAAGYEAATWKLWLLDNPQSLVVAPPPDATKTKAELQALKQALRNTDAQKLAQIKYWDAGAPSYRWNQIAPKLLNLRQELMLRTPTAWMNLAVYDATVLAWKEKAAHKRQRPSTLDASLKPAVHVPQTYSYPCEHTVTAAAAAYVLAYFFPDKKDSLLGLARAASQSRIDAGVQFPSDAEAGWKLGEGVALQIVEKAKADGADKKYTGEVNKDPKKWTGPFAMGIQLAYMTPIVLQSVSQFRPPAPPDFAADMKELQAFKRTFKSNSQAYYWANSGGYDYWSEAAALKMFEYGIDADAPAAARIYTVLHTAYHEAALAIFDAKYAYWGIRPVQYDTTYKPLIATPPFPGYPSGHAMGAATTAAVLSYFFPADAAQFQKLAQDCADSRFYAGIHFRTDNEVGLQLGKKIGEYVVKQMVER